MNPPNLALARVDSTTTEATFYDRNGKPGAP